MAGFVRMLAVFGFLLLPASSAQAFGGRFFHGYYASHGYHTSYYYYPVAYYYPVYSLPPVCPTIIPVMPAASTLYAVPRAAPPSQTVEPPTSSLDRPPKVTESRSGSKYPPMSAEDSVRVGFWNVTGRDVNIVINGQSRLLPSNRAVTLDLARTFTYQVDARSPQSAQVPVGQSTLEIILRQ